MKKFFTELKTKVGNTFTDMDEFLNRFDGDDDDNDYDYYITLCNRGITLFEAGNYKEAIKAYQEFIEGYRDGKIPKFHKWNNWHANYHCGLAYLHLDELSKALEYFKEATNERGFTTVKERSETYERQGFIHLLLGEFPQARQSFDTSFDPMHKSLGALTLFHSGILRFLMGEDVKAVEEIQEALAINAPQVKEAAATLCEKISNKNSPLYKDSETIIAYLKNMSCLEQSQKPSQDTSYSFTEYRKKYFRLFLNSKVAKEKELMVDFITDKEIKVDQTASETPVQSFSQK